MTYTVGAKGQVVIAKDIRDRLGIGPGWVAVQRLEGNEVRLVFLPPEHNRSLKGSLSQYARATVDPGEWDAARQQAWEAAGRERDDSAAGEP